MGSTCVLMHVEPMSILVLIIIIIVLAVLFQWWLYI